MMDTIQRSLDSITIEMAAYMAFLIGLMIGCALTIVATSRAKAVCDKSIAANKRAIALCHRLIRKAP